MSILQAFDLKSSSILGTPNIEVKKDDIYSLKNNHMQVEIHTSQKL